MSYFFKGDVTAYTHSNTHVTLEMECKTPLSFVRKVRKMLVQYEDNARLICREENSLHTFTVDRFITVESAKQIWPELQGLKILRGVKRMDFTLPMSSLGS